MLLSNVYMLLQRNILAIFGKNAIVIDETGKKNGKMKGGKL